jgi:hypothetical protein
MFEMLIPLQETGGLLEPWSNWQFLDAILRPFLNVMGPAFVIWAIIAFGGSQAIYSRSAAPLAVVTVVVGGVAASVIPGIGLQLMMLLAIAAGATALWSLYRGVVR